VLQVGDVVGVADDPDGLVTAFGQQPLQVLRDLPMTSGHHHTHVVPLVASTRPSPHRTYPRGRGGHR
jgi:hypothetical protein